MIRVFSYGFQQRVWLHLWEPSLESVLLPDSSTLPRAGGQRAVDRKRREGGGERTNEIYQRGKADTRPFN